MLSIALDGLTEEVREHSVLLEVLDGQGGSHFVLGVDVTEVEYESTLHRWS